MESNVLTIVLMPMALGVIMFGLGLSLTIDDFKRVYKFPKAVFVGLLCQLIILPLVCFGLIYMFGLSPELAVGLMLLAASPGGPTANLYSHLFGGNVALNITLTAVNSVLALFTLPLIVNFSIKHFMHLNEVVPLQLSKVIEVFLIVMVPVSIGMWVNSKSKKMTEKISGMVKVLSAIFLILIIVGAIYKEKQNIIIYFKEAGLAALSFNILSLMLGYFMARIFSINKSSSMAIAMEVGIHNGTLAIYIALVVIGNSIVSIPAAIYSIIMFFTALLFGYLFRVRKNNLEAVAGAN